MREFVDPSEKAVIGTNDRIFVKKYDFPWAQVPEGKSFAVAPDEVKSLQILRSMASAKGIKLGRVFRVVNHGTSYEVYNQGPRDVSKASTVPVGIQPQAPAQAPTPAVDDSPWRMPFSSSGDE